MNPSKIAEPASMQDKKIGSENMSFIDDKRRWTFPLSPY